MLPYTTYQIPENGKTETAAGSPWLWMLFSKPLNEAEKDFVLKISAALKAEFNQDVYSMICNPDQPISVPSGPGSKPKLILSFGVSPNTIGVWIDLFKPGMISLEHMTFILTLPADILAGNAVAKKELWRHMQLYMETA